MGEKHVLTIPGRYNQIKRVCSFVADGAAQADLSESDRFHVELACDEACTNIIEHAYGGEGIGDIVVSWAVDDNKFIIELHDNGRSFNPSNVPEPPIRLTSSSPPSEKMIQSLKAGGLGIHFMRKIMDEVHFQFDPSSGNTLTMIKRLAS